MLLRVNLHIHNSFTVARIMSVIVCVCGGGGGGGGGVEVCIALYSVPHKIMYRIRSI